MKYSFLPGLLLIVCFSCKMQKPAILDSNKKIVFKHAVELPYDYQFKNTKVGGLSGIDYDAANDVYYLISDDRSDHHAARFYTAKIQLSGNRIDSIRLINTYQLSAPNHLPFPDRKLSPHTAPDPESIRYDAKRKQLVWSSEGERSFRNGDTILQNPYVQLMSATGGFLGRFKTPDLVQVHAIQKGSRHNGSWEGLSFSSNFKKLWVSMEEPIFEDGPRAGTGDSSAWIRIFRYDVKSREPEAQYVYQIDPVAYIPEPADSFKINGVVEILEVGKRQLLVLERSFSTGRKGCVVKLYLADFSKATDVSTFKTLQGKTFAPASKRLLLNMESLNFTIYNIEGMTFGPVMNNGTQTLIFVADDNFSKEDRTQILYFAIE